jgi:hypothetical protein
MARVRRARRGVGASWSRRAPEYFAARLRPSLFEHRLSAARASLHLSLGDTLECSRAARTRWPFRRRHCTVPTSAYLRNAVPFAAARGAHNELAGDRGSCVSIHLNASFAQAHTRSQRPIISHRGTDFSLDWMTGWTTYRTAQASRIAIVTRRNAVPDDALRTSVAVGLRQANYGRSCSARASLLDGLLAINLGNE